MAVQNGKDLLIKIDTTGSGGFETMAGLRAPRISLNASPVDVTTLDSPGGWRELLAGAGVKTAAISGAGVFRDATTDATARQMFFDGAARSLRRGLTRCGGLLIRSSLCPPNSVSPDHSGPRRARDISRSVRRALRSHHTKRARCLCGPICPAWPGYHHPTA